jgi:hypothetical protein
MRVQGAENLKAGLTPYQCQYFSWLLSRRIGAESADMLASRLVHAFNFYPHRVYPLNKPI